MTVSSSTRKSGPYIGDGVNTSFPFDFKVFAKEDVQPVFTNADGNESNLVLDSDYTVLLNLDQDQNPGGTVTYPIQIGATNLSALERITLIGGMVVDQQTDITNVGRFLPQVQENAFDKLTILIQQLQEVAGRTLRAAVGTTVKLVFPAPSSGKFIAWRTDLTGLENKDAGTDSMALQGLLADAANPAHGSNMVGFRQAGAGSSLRTVLSKLRDTIDLRDFGAVGDGIVNDTAAILAAVASLPADGGEIVVGKGKYLFNATITLSKPIRFRGAGCGSTNNGPAGSVLLKAASLNGPGIVLAALGASLQNLSVQGQVGNGGDGVVLLESRCVLEDVSVFGMGTDGIRVGQDAAPNNVNAWNIRNVRAKNNGRHGLHISSKVRPALPDANAGILSGADFQLNAECGMYLGNCGFNKFSGLCIQANGTYGVRCSPSSYSNQFDGGDYEVNGRVGGSTSTSYYDFWIESGSVNNKLFGGLSYNFPQSFKCDEPKNLIVGFEDGIYSGDKKYTGIQLMNNESSVPTVLDWYEEGAWTPVMEGTTGAGTATYSTQVGRFTRIGNMVTAVWDMTYSGHTGTGDGRISGLPYNAAATPTFQAATIVPGNMTTPANSVVAAMAVANTKKINLYSISTSGTTAFAALALDVANSNRGQVTYLIP